MQIQFESATKIYWGNTALKNFSLTIESGKLVAVLGVNGAGKSTLLRCLSTQIMLTRGLIRLGGEQLVRERMDLRRRFHWIHDAPAGFQNMDLLAQIAVTLEAYGSVLPGIVEQIDGLIQEFSLAECEYRPVSQLSRGQRFKAALIAMIALDRELWLIDEPFASGIDPQGMKAFKKHARESTGRGNTVIYTTQILEIAETFADQVIVLDRGKLVAFGTLDEIKNSSRGEKSLQGFFDQFYFAFSFFAMVALAIVGLGCMAAGGLVLAIVGSLPTMAASYGMSSILVWAYHRSPIDFL